MLNLQSNALKFSSEGGKVTCNFNVYQIHGHSYCEVHVIDTGSGIKEKDKEKLFKLFGFVDTT